MAEETADAGLRAGSIDTETLAEYLAAPLGEHGPLNLSPVSGGLSNPTYFMTFGRGSFVLRKKPDGPTLPSAHAIDREFRVLSALRNTAVPVPEALHYCADDTVIGTPFYVMSRLDGRVFHENDLPGIAPDERAAIFAAMADTLAALHAIDVDAVGLGDFGRKGGFIPRQIDRWMRQYEAGKVREVPEIPALGAWLADHLPAGDETTLVHSDFRLGNLVLHKDRPEIIGVLDWELATLGHPLADLGYNLMPWIMDRSEYHGLGGHDLAALGIPSMQSYAARYLRRRGLPEDVDPYFIAFAFFRLAAILEGVYSRGVQGIRPGEEAKAISHYSAVFARHGLKLAGV